MRIIGLGAAAAAAMLSTATVAQVTGVVTSTTAAITFRPDLSGNNVVHTYSGDQIAGSLGSLNFGSGANFASTSEVDPGLIAFENGNSSWGEYAFVTSQTDVDVTYKNETGAPVTPSLRSQIVPAGLGVYVGSPCSPGVSCPGYSGNRDFQSFSKDAISGPGGAGLAGASIDFKILSDGVAIYDLTASVNLVRDPITGANVFVDNLAQAQSTLAGFQLETAPGSQTQYGFNWQATDLDIGLPELVANGSATLTYQTTVQTYARSECFDSRTSACLIAYSAFGDPIGGGTGIKPSADQSLDAAFDVLGPITHITYQSFGFDFPTFNDGVLSFQYAGPLAVPEPATWLLMISGAGLVGGALRRRRVAGLKESNSAA